MAVEARHLNLFPRQILSNREMVTDGVEGNVNFFGNANGCGLVAPLSGTTTVTGTVVPMYGSAINDTLIAKTAAMESDSGLTCAVLATRKRSRDAISPMLSSLRSGDQNQIGNYRGGCFTILGEDASFQIQQQQLEIDLFVGQHTEKVRMEIEERRKAYSRRITAAVEENITKKMKAKEEEIDKIGKLNFALEERVRVLSMENQMWRDLAQKNEAAANTLRCNLEQAIDQQRFRADEAVLNDDAQSCCGNNYEEFHRRTVGDSTSRDRNHNNANDWSTAPSTEKHSSTYMMCRSCWEVESCVLLLPCRHLCLCTVCGSSLHTCPICKSTKTASVHVNLSS